MSDNPRNIGAAWREAVRRHADWFAAGVAAQRGASIKTPLERCDGCGKWMTPSELAGVTEYGALCRECYEGTNDGR